MKNQKKVMLFVVICLVMLLFPIISSAEILESTVKVSSNTVEKGEVFDIFIYFNGVTRVDSITFEENDVFDYFYFCHRYNSSVSANKEYATCCEYYQSLRINETGTYEIKPIVKYKGEIFDAGSVVITVVDPINSTENNPPQFFAERLVSHEEAYLGEQIVVSYNVYSTEKIWSSYPGGYDLQNEEIVDFLNATMVYKIPSRLQFETVNLNGIEYYKCLINCEIISPLTSGIRYITAKYVVFETEEEDETSVLQPFKKNYLPLDDKKTLIIKPLPEGKPSDFSGIVGDINLESTISATEINFGDVITFNVKISGTANLELFDKIFGKNIPGFIVYERVIESIEKIVDGLFYAEKLIEIKLVPEWGGNLIIPQISVSYFDTVSESYQNEIIPVQQITVIGGPEHIFEESEIYEKVLINQVNYSANNEKYFTLQIEKETFEKVLIFIAVAAVITICAIYIVYQGKNKDKILISIYKNMQSEQDINKIYNHFNSMIKHKFGVNVKSLSKEAVKQSIPENFSEKVTEIMDYMETNDEKSVTYIKTKIKEFYINMKKIAK